MLPIHFDMPGLPTFADRQQQIRDLAAEMSYNKRTRNTRPPVTKRRLAAMRLGHSELALAKAKVARLRRS